MIEEGEFTTPEPIIDGLGYLDDDPYDHDIYDIPYSVYEVQSYPPFRSEYFLLIKSRYVLQFNSYKELDDYIVSASPLTKHEILDIISSSIRLSSPLPLFDNAFLRGEKGTRKLIHGPRRTFYD